MRPGAISTVVIKAIRLCNLRCPYCYYINDTTPQTDRLITSVTIERLYERVADYLQNDSQPFAFVWHGGEPTLLGLKRFGHFVDLQSKYFDSGRVENALQTNGTLITDDWCELFKHYDVKIGVSLDGYKEVHDRHRITVRGEGSYDQAVDAIRLLAKHGVNVGILMVVDGSADASTTVRTLRQLGIGYCDFLLPMSNNALQANLGNRYTDDYCDFGAVGRFLREAFVELARDPSPVLNVRIFDSLINNAFGLPNAYLNAGSTNVAENVILETDGTLCLDADFWQIERFGLGQEYRLQYDIHASDFTFGALESQLRELIRDKGLECLPADCQSCRVRSLCRASHPASRYGLDGSFDHRSAYCEAMYAVCDEVVDYLVDGGYTDILWDRDLRTQLYTEFEQREQSHGRRE